MNLSSINVLTYNCNSLRASTSRVKELILFLRKYSVTVALLNETFLKSNDVLHIPGYIVMRTDSQGRGAGTAIIIRNDIDFTEIAVPQTSSFHDVTGIRIFNNKVTCTIFSVYVPNTTGDIQSQCLNRLLSCDDKVLIGGDFNARSPSWGCNSSNSRGKSLDKFTQEP